MKAALRDVAAAVEAPSLQGMKLILRPDDSSLAIIGEVLLGHRILGKEVTGLYGMNRI